MIGIDLLLHNSKARPTVYSLVFALVTLIPNGVRAQAADSEWDPPVLIGVLKAPVGSNTYMELAVGSDRKGLCIALWREYDPSVTSYALLVSRSLDHGSTWLPAQLLISGVDPIVGKRPNPMGITADGEGNWIVYDNVSTGTTNSRRTASYFISRNSGESWTACRAFGADSSDSDGYSYPLAACGPNGTWVALWHTSSGKTLSSHTETFGDTWSLALPVPIPAANDWRPSDFRTDGAGNYVIIGTGQPTSSVPQFTVDTIKSANSGMTWADPVTLSVTACSLTSSNRLSHPGIEYVGDNKWVAAFRYTDPWQYMSYARQSIDGGRTWGSTALLAGSIDADHFYIASDRMGEVDVAGEEVSAKSLDYGVTWTGLGEAPSLYRGGLAYTGAATIAVYPEFGTDFNSTIGVYCKRHRANSADMAVDIEQPQQPAYVGQTLEYRIIVRNLGQSAARNAFARCTLPEGPVLSSASCSAGTLTNINGTLTWEMNLVPAQSAAVITVQMVPQSAGTLACSATVGTESPETYLSNNTAEKKMTVVVAADLSLTMSPATQNCNLGGSIAFDLTVTNLGPSTAEQVLLFDTLPSGLTFLQGESGAGYLYNGEIRYDLGRLSSQQSCSVRLAARADRAGQYTNKARVSSNGYDPVPGSNFPESSVTVTDAGSSVDLEVTQSAPESPLPVSKQFSYTAKIRNKGPVPATSVSMTDTLPTGVRFEGATAASGSCTQTSGKVSCSISSIGVGEEKNVTIAVVPQNTGTIVNSVSAFAGGQNESQSSDNTAQLSREVTDGAVASGVDVTGSFIAGETSAVVIPGKRGSKTVVKAGIQIVNQGTALSKACKIRVNTYLGDSVSSNQGWVALTGKTVTLKPGKAAHVAVSRKLKSGVSVSGKYLIAVIDANNRVPGESNRGNNTVGYGPL